MKALPLALFFGLFILPSSLQAGGEEDSPENILSPNPIMSYMRNKGEQKIIIPLPPRKKEHSLVLMIPRNSIHYQIPIHALAHDAIAENPEAAFKIISLIPASTRYESSDDEILTAAENMEKILNVFDHLQIPRERIHASYQRDAGLVVNSVQISVQNPEYSIQ